MSDFIQICILLFFFVYNYVNLQAVTSVNNKQTSFENG